MREYRIRKKVSLTPDEWAQVNKEMVNSLCPSLNSYIRKRLLSKPVTAWYRNRSFDEFIEALVDWRNALKTLMDHPSLDKSTQEQIIQLIESVKPSINKIVDYVTENHGNKRCGPLAEV